MRKLDLKDIENFYKCYQEQIGPSTISNLSDQEIDEICDNTVSKIEQIRQSSKIIVNNLKGQSQANSTSLPTILTLLMEQNCLFQLLHITEDKIIRECGLEYFPEADHRS